MAGEVRQPIDLPALERYIDQNVPALKTPLGLKQVSTGFCSCLRKMFEVLTIYGI